MSDQEPREEPDINQTLVFFGVAVTMLMAVGFGLWLFIHLPPP